MSEEMKKDNKELGFIKKVNLLANNILSLQDISKNIDAVNSNFKNIDIIKNLHKNIDNIKTAVDNTEDLKTVTQNISSIKKAVENIENIIAIASKINEIIQVSANTPQIEIIFNSLEEIKAVYTNITDLLEVKKDVDLFKQDYKEFKDLSQSISALYYELLIKIANFDSAVNIVLAFDKDLRQLLKDELDKLYISKDIENLISIKLEEEFAKNIYLQVTIKEVKEAIKEDILNLHLEDYLIKDELNTILDNAIKEAKNNLNISTKTQIKEEIISLHLEDYLIKDELDAIIEPKIEKQTKKIFDARPENSIIFVSDYYEIPDNTTIEVKEALIVGYY